MNTKQRLHTSISLGAKVASFVLLMLVTACGGQETPDVEKEDKLQLSDQEITLGVDGWNSMTSSRATIFENLNDVLNDSLDGKGGGYLTMHAYLRETGYHFIPGSCAWYFVPDDATTGSWRFWDTVKKDFFSYYWPQSGAVDFFAYMPYSGSDRLKNITVGNYIPGTGLNITCEMNQPTSSEDTDGQETIFAYTTNKSKADGSVGMHFVHPFAAVYFELKQAHRNLTINEIRFNDVYLTGVDTLTATTDNNSTITWTGTGERDTLTIPIQKIIPEQINFGAEIGGPYLVMPQNFEYVLGDASKEVTVTIDYTWDNADPNNQDDVIAGDEDTNPTDDVYKIRRSIKSSSLTKWEAGKKYTYILNLGDNKEEILFQVKVEPWDAVEYKNEIEVE